MKEEKIDGGNAFDWNGTSGDYAKYRDIYPKELYDALHFLGVGEAEQHILDIGTGTGVIPRNMYPFGGRFTGLDIAEEQIKEARALTKEMNTADSIQYVVGSGEKLPFSSHQFDVVTAVQCWVYLDPTKAVSEIRRVLKQGGALFIVYMAWLPDENPVVQRSIEVVHRLNPAWNGYDSRAQLIQPDWCGQSFRMTAFQTIDVAIPFTRDSWNGRMKASRGVGATLSAPLVEQFSAQHMEMLNHTMDEQFTVKHEISIQRFQAL